MKKWLALFLVLMLFSTAAFAETYETVLNPTSAAPISVTLDNLDLDGTLVPGMFEGQTINVVTLQTNYGEALKEYGALFEKLTGCKVNVEVFAEGDGTEKVSMALATGGIYDMIMVKADTLINYASAGYIKDLTSLIEEHVSAGYDIEDFASGVFEASKYNGQIISIPFYPVVMMLYYRADLFEDEANQAAFLAKYGRELTVPTTPEEMEEVAAFFTKSLNPDSPVDYGMVAKIDDDPALWVNRLGYYGGTILDEDYNVGFSNGSGLKALQSFKNMLAYMPEDIMSFDWDLLYSYYAAGNAAMCEAWPGLAKVCESATSNVGGKVGYTLTPGNTPALSGWSIGVTSDAKNEVACWKFIEMCTSKSGELMKVQYSCIPCRASNYARSDVQQASPHFREMLDCLNAAKIFEGTVIPYVSADLNDVLKYNIERCLLGEITPEETIDILSEEMTEIIDEVRDEL